MKMIQNLLLAAIVAVFLAGCSAAWNALVVGDKAYKVAKGVYQIGRKVVIINEDLIGPEAMAALKTIDEYAGRVDTAHDLIKERLLAAHDGNATSSQTAATSSSSAPGK